MRRSNGTGSATGGETTGVRARAPVAVARPRRWRVVLATLVSGLAVGGVAWATEKEAGAGARASGGGAEPASAPADRAQAPAWLPIGDEPPPSPAPDEDPADAPPLPPDDVPPDDESEPEGPGADSLPHVSGDAQAVDIRGRNADLAKVVLELSRVAGLNAVVAPGITEVAHVTLLQISPREALDLLARMSRCEIEELPGGVLLVTQAPRVTLAVDQSSGRTALQLVSAYSGHDVLVEPRVTGAVSLSLQDVRWREALRRIVAGFGAHLAWRGDVALVTAAPLPVEALGYAPADPVLVHTRQGETHVGELRGEAQGQLTIDDAASGEPRVLRREEVLAIEPVRPEARRALAGARTWSDRRVDLDLTDAELATACEQLGRELGVPIQVRPGVSAPPISCSLRQVSGRAAVEVLALLAGCSVEDGRGSAVVLSQRPRMTLRAADCSASALYRLLGSAAGRRVVVEAEVDGIVDLELEHVGPLDALHAVALVHGHTVASSGEDEVTVRPAAYAGSWKLPLAAPGADPERTERGPANDEPAPSPEVEAAREARIEALFARIERLAEARRVEELIASFTELRELMAESPEAAEQVRRRLAAGQRHLEGFGEVALSIELQILINEGNRHLQAMATAVEEERFRDAQSAFTNLEALAAKAAQHEREVFQRNGAALLARGRALVARARELEALANLPLELTAILRFGPGAPERDAAVVNGWVLREGEAPRDARGDPLEGMELVEVEPGGVRFLVNGATVERRLSAPRR